VASSNVEIVQRRSANGASREQRETLRSLGLGRIGRRVERRDGPELRGMLRVVGHMVEVAEAQSSGDRARGSGKEASDG
jgi:large subunit ribosomal protein L30